MWLWCFLASISPSTWCTDNLCSCVLYSYFVEQASVCGMFYSACLEKCLWDSRGKPALKFRIWLNLICSSDCKEHPAYGNIVVMEIMAPVVCSLCQNGFRDFHIARQVVHSIGTYSWNRWVWTLLIMKNETSYSSCQVLCSAREVFLNGFGLVSVQFRSHVTASLALVLGKNHGVTE
jgi:hypothetical protein